MIQKLWHPKKLLLFSFSLGIKYLDYIIMQYNKMSLLCEIQLCYFCLFIISYSYLSRHQHTVIDIPVGTKIYALAGFYCIFCAFVTWYITRLSWIILRTKYAFTILTFFYRASLFKPNLWHLNYVNFKLLHLQIIW